jgi:hypothetical protein
MGQAIIGLGGGVETILVHLITGGSLRPKRLEMSMFS